MPKRGIWPVRSIVYWCVNCNVPLLEAKCYKCGERGVKLNLHEPGDARPALKGDIKHIEEGVIQEFGDNSLVDKLRLSNTFILLNKVPHFDLMREIIADGNIVGKMFYDPFKKKWRFKLSYFSAKICVENELCPKIKVMGRVKGLDKLVPTKPIEKGRQVVVVDNENEPIALGISTGKYVSVRTIFKDKRILEVSGVNSTLNDVLKANDLPLHNMASRSLKMLYVMSNKVQKDVLISYSGGKDSLVSLHLALRLGVDGKVLFNDTGIELPETLKAVEDIVDKYGLDLYVASAKNAFWESVNVFGPPARDYRWCCKVVKLVPLAKLTKSMWPNGALNIVGQRAFESLDRAKTPQVWRNKWVPHLLSISLIQYWNQLAIWLYIFKNKLSYNKLYDEGFDRIGCYLCPASYMAEFRLIEECHPEEWCRWYKVLNTWREKLNYPKEWIEYGLWRWLGPSTAKERLVKKLRISIPQWQEDYKIRSKIDIGHLKIENNEVSATFNRSLPIQGIIDQAPILFSEYEVKLSNKSLVLKTKNIEVSLSNSRITIKCFRGMCKNLLELFIDILKALYKWENCVHCGSCELWCSAKALKLTPKPSVNPYQCLHCKVCLDVCPLSDLMVEKTIVTRLLNNPYGWKRKTKRKREDLIKYLRSIYGRRNGN